MAAMSRAARSLGSPFFESVGRPRMLSPEIRSTGTRPRRAAACLALSLEGARPQQNQHPHGGPRADRGDREQPIQVGLQLRDGGDMRGDGAPELVALLPRGLDAPEQGAFHHRGAAAGPGLLEAALLAPEVALDVVEPR